jgi:phosphatidylserine/phosphatidylglycerophosphate/cardiolipin synthase-like enzyme
MDVPTAIAKFFTTAADATGSGENADLPTSGNKVTYLVDGDNYFHAIRAEMANLKSPGFDQFFYFTSWVLNLVDWPAGSIATGSDWTSAWTNKFDGVPALTVTDEAPGASYPLFIDDLTQMAQTGNTDVRMLVWCNPWIVTYSRFADEASSEFQNMAMNLLSVNAVRAKKGLEKSACLCTIAHPFGALHAKIVICGDDTSARAYIGGMDFFPTREDGQKHKHPGWHDVAVCIEGPAVGSLYIYFQDIWNEQLKNPQKDPDKFFIGSPSHPFKVKSFEQDTPPVPARYAARIDPAPGTTHVQVLRTAPQINISADETPNLDLGWYARWAVHAGRPTWSFAPNGIFEFEPALKKAIANAQAYIYVEDEGFFSAEIMDWICARMGQPNPPYVMLVHGTDPADLRDNPNTNDPMFNAVNYHLIAGLDPAALNRIAFYERIDRVTMHAKTWIIDDVFAIVGSANAYRRSLYTDIEASIGFIDEPTPGMSGGIVSDYRTNLWAEHCGVTDSTGRAAYADLNFALGIWNPAWQTVPGALPSGLLSGFQAKTLPFGPGTSPDTWNPFDTTYTEQQASRWDPDSRMTY